MVADVKDLEGWRGYWVGEGLWTSLVQLSPPHPQKLLVTVLCDVSLGKIYIQQLHGTGRLVIQTMEFISVLSFLNTCAKSCLSFGSTCLQNDPNFTILCGLGLLLLFLCYLMGIPFPPWKTKPIQGKETWESSQYRLLWFPFLFPNFINLFF